MQIFRGHSLHPVGEFGEDAWQKRIRGDIWRSQGSKWVWKHSKKVRGPGMHTNADSQLMPSCLPALPSRFLNSIWSPQRVSGDRYVMVYSCSMQETLKVSLTHSCGYLGLALATANSFWLPALGPVVVISMTTLSTLTPVVRPIVPSELEPAARTSTEL